MTDLIRTPVDLRPGDIMFGPITGAVGLGVGLGQLMLGEGFRVGRVSVRHVAIVTEAAQWDPVAGEYAPARLVEAMPSGARDVALLEDRWTDRHAYVRLPEDYPGQAEDAAAIARLMVAERVAYSFASYAYLAAWRWGLQTPHVERWINRRRPAQWVPQVGAGVAYPSPRHGMAQVALPCEAICSVLVDQAWSLAGKRVAEDVARQAVTPGMLATQLTWRTDATWAFPQGPDREARSWVV